MTDIEQLPLGPHDAGGDLVEIGPRSFVLVRGSRRWLTLVVVASVVAVVLIVAAAFVLPSIEARLVTRFVALSVALLGLQFVVGPSGQLSLCHGVFVGVGSYAMTIAVARYGASDFVGLAVAPVVGFVAGCLVGVLALRIKATYLGPVTLGVAVAFPMILKRFTWYTGGSSGLPLVRQLRPPSWFGATTARLHQWTHLLIVAIAIIAAVVARNVVASRVGLAVRATAENALSAAASGVHVRRLRVVAYGWGAALGALGGALLVMDTPVVGADNYDLFRSLGYYAAVMVGGAALMSGAVVAAALLVAVPWIIDTFSVRAAPNMVLGVLLVAATLVAPDGLAALVGGRLRDLVEVRDPLDDAHRRRVASRPDDRRFAAFRPGLYRAPPGIPGTPGEESR